MFYRLKVLAAQARQGSPVHLRVAADEIVHARTEGAACSIFPRLRRFIAPLLEDSLALVNQALGDVEDQRAAIGASRATLERANAAHDDARLLLQKVVGDVEDVDMAEAVTRMVGHQTTLQSAMLTLSRLEGLSLANYLR